LAWVSGSWSCSRKARLARTESNAIRYPIRAPDSCEAHRVRWRHLATIRYARPLCERLARPRWRWRILPGATLR